MRKASFVVTVQHSAAFVGHDKPDKGDQLQLTITRHSLDHPLRRGIIGIPQLVVAYLSPIMEPLQRGFAGGGQSTPTKARIPNTAKPQHTPRQNGGTDTRAGRMVGRMFIWEARP